MPVNNQARTLSAGGVLTLTGSPTGSGLYTVSKDAGAGTPQVISAISGGSGFAVITLKAAVTGAIRLDHNGTSFFLQQGLSWLPGTTRDRITLRDDNGDGTVWVEEIGRVSF
jgi:hypothetical protein